LRTNPRSPRQGEWQVQQPARTSFPKLRRAAPHTTLPQHMAQRHAGEIGSVVCQRHVPALSALPERLYLLAHERAPSLPRAAAYLRCAGRFVLFDRFTLAATARRCRRDTAAAVFACYCDTWDNVVAPCVASRPWGSCTTGAGCRVLVQAVLCGFTQLSICHPNHGREQGLCSCMLTLPTTTPRGVVCATQHAVLLTSFVCCRRERMSVVGGRLRRQAELRMATTVMAAWRTCCRLNARHGLLLARCRGSSRRPSMFSNTTLRSRPR